MRHFFFSLFIELNLIAVVFKHYLIVLILAIIAYRLSLDISGLVLRYAICF